MAGKSKIAGLVHVLDEQHINAYLTKMTTHLYDSAEDGRVLLRKAIRSERKSDFAELAEQIAAFSNDEAVQNRVREAAKYIMGNRSAAKLRLKRAKGVVGSSTEAHVSHVLAST